MDDNHIKLSSHFNITVQEISELLSAKNKDLLDGGVENLAKKLNTSIESGIPEDEEIDNYKDRIETYVSLLFEYNFIYMILDLEQIHMMNHLINHGLNYLLKHLMILL